MAGFVLKAGLLSTSSVSFGRSEAPYDEARALHYMQYARAAFCQGPSITNWDCGEMCDAVPTVKGKVKFVEPSSDKYQVQGYVAEVPAQEGQHGTHCVVAFRGSVKWQNWVEDFWYPTEAWPRTNGRATNASWCQGCEVHSGFAIAFDHVQEPMTQAIKQFGCSNLVISGHSLGAAMSTLAAAYVRGALGLHIDNVYTYGKPRVGNYAFVSAFLDLAEKDAVSPAMWRIVHYHDPVPRIPAPKGTFPSAIWAFEYAHETEEVYYGNRESSIYSQCPPAADNTVNRFENPMCSFATPLIMCIDNDHVTYLNKTFKHTDLGTKCIGEQVVI